MKIIKNALVLSFAILAGCGSKQDANNSNFEVAIEEEFRAGFQRDLCFNVPAFPASAKDRYDFNLDATKMHLLVDSGIITAPSSSSEYYELTDLGAKYYRKVREYDFGSFCYGKFALDKVVKWEWNDNDAVANQEVIVTYLLKISDMADWAQDSNIQDSIGGLNDNVNHIKKEQRVVLKLTSVGWKVKRRIYQ